MDEFLKINWRKRNINNLMNSSFLSDDTILEGSHVYKNFIQPLKANNIIINNDKVVGKKSSLAVRPLYVPGKQLFRPIRRRSLLTKTEKLHCFRALKLILTGREPNTTTEKYQLSIYNKCRAALNEENAAFQRYVQMQWKKSRISNIRPSLRSYGEQVWCRRKLESYSQHSNFLYAQCEQINFAYNETEHKNVQYRCNAVPLEVGSVAKFVRPTLKDQCTLKTATLPNLNVSSGQNDHFSLDQDENLKEILRKHREIDVVVTSGGLKRLLDKSDLHDTWLVPFKIVESAEEKNRKIVLIEKPLGKLQPNGEDLKLSVYKTLLKTNLCQYEAFSFPQQQQFENPLEEENREKSSVGKLHLNSSYRIWNISNREIGNKSTVGNLLKSAQKKSTFDKDIHLLVRTKLDGCELLTTDGTNTGNSKNNNTVLQPVMVRPHLEYQLQYGGQIPSKKQLAHEWTTLFFRPFSILYRVRLQHFSTEIIACEKCTMQKINTEAMQHYEFRPHLGLGPLYTLLQRLVTLDNGQYLLQHRAKDENFVTVLKAYEKSNIKIPSGNLLDLGSETKRFKIIPSTEKNTECRPIDVNYILPIHEFSETLPATFHGFDKFSTYSNFGVKNTNRRKLKKRTKKKKSKKRGKNSKFATTTTTTNTNINNTAATSSSL